MHSAPVSTRRDFLRQSLVASAAFGVPALVRGANLNSRVQMATIGVNGKGYGDLHNFFQHEKVKYVGFCDIDARAFEKADKLIPGVPHFADFREMFAKLGDTLDAVDIATPDHMHALPAVEAMKRGKHVYCQKPLAHTVWECRQLQLWAAKKGVVTQMGNQIHSAVEYRMATRLIREGAIGKVREVHSWLAYTGNERTRLLEPPVASAPVPSEVKWDLWLGGAPKRAYAPVYHPFAWRDWQDFGGGALGDFGCHILDPVFTSLGIRTPTAVTADNTGVNRHVWPTAQTIRYTFPGTEFTAGPTLKVTWSDGGLRPDRKLAKLPPELDLPKNGSLFIGEKGNMVLPHVGGPRLYPLDEFKGFAYPKDIKGLNHYHRFVDAILGGTKTSDGFDYAGPLAETVQLGNIATRAVPPPPPQRGSNVAKEPLQLQWDGPNLRFKNSDVANALLTKSYRPGWEVTPA